MPRCPDCGGLVTVQDESCPKCGKVLEKEPPPPALTPLEQRVLDLMRQNQKIEAIKVYRDETNVGLKEAKDFVEALADRHGVPQPAGCSKAAAVLAALVLGSVGLLLGAWAIVS
jgi:hypothetical protein